MDSQTTSQYGVHGRQKIGSVWQNHVGVVGCAIYCYFVLQVNSPFYVTAFLSHDFARSFPTIPQQLLSRNMHFVSQSSATVLRMATSSKDLKRKRQPALTPPTKKLEVGSGNLSSDTHKSNSDSSYRPSSAANSRGRNNVVARLAKAAKEAAASRQCTEVERKTENNAANNKEERTQPQSTSNQSKYPTRHATRKRTHHQGYGGDYYDGTSQDGTSKRQKDLPTIASLNQVIEDELLKPSNGLKPLREIDSLRLLLEHNNMNSDSSSSESIKSNKSSIKGVDRNARHTPNQAAIVFARPLIDNQITIEFATRLVSLAKAIKFENYQPEWICFCPQMGTVKGGYGLSSDSSTWRPTHNSVSDTAAGIVFFRHLCAANDISLEGVGLRQIMEQWMSPLVMRQISDAEGADTTANVNVPTVASWSPSFFLPVVESLVDEGYLDQWLAQSTEYESETDEYGMTRKEPRKKIQIQWTLFSSDYDLCNLNDIHVRSPRQSPLSRLAQKLEHAVRQKEGFRRGIVHTSWHFRYSIYPYIVYSDVATPEVNLVDTGGVGDSDLTAFLGKCYLMAQELIPLMVNLRGVAENSEFFQRENYRQLVKTRRSLATLLEQMNESYCHNREFKSENLSIPPTLKAQLKQVSTNKRSSRIRESLSMGKPTSSTEIQIESALLSLGRCCDLVRPAGTFSAQSVTRQEWKDALQHLQDFMNRIEVYCDPDQTLPAKQWGVQLLKDEPTPQILLLR